MPSDQASRRSSPVLDKGPPGPFSATLYLKIECRGKRRPSGHPGTGRACPPRCLVRWKCDSPRSFTTSRRSAGHRLGRNSAVSRAVPEPFLDPNGRVFWGFEAQKRLKDHRQRRTCWPQHQTCPSACYNQTKVMLGPTGAPLVVIF